MNEFAKRYQSISDSALLNILQNPEDYKPEAIEAAQVEWDKRALNEEDIEQANLILEKKEAKKIDWSAKANSIKQKFESNLDQKPVLDDSILDGWQTEEVEENRRLNRYINRILGGMCIILLLGIVKMAYIAYNYISFKVHVIVIIIAEAQQLIIMTLKIVLLYFFWKRFKNAWILLCLYITYYFFRSIINVVKNTESLFEGKEEELYLYLVLLVVMLLIGLYGALLWLLNRPEVRQAYKVNRDTMILIVITAGILLFAFNYRMILG